MKIILTSAGSDSRGMSGWEGNEPLGDNTGREFRTVEYDPSFYNDKKTCVLRCTNSAIGNAIRIRHRQMADNNCFGYDQSKRMTALAALRRTKNYDPSLTTELCACDCSSSVGACVVLTLETQGIKTNITGSEVTATMRDAYLKSGWFTDVTASVDLSTGKGLQPGDIVDKQGKHVVIVWDVEEDKTVRSGKTTTALYMREAPVNGKVILVIPAGASVTINSEKLVESGAKWYNVTYHGATGFASAKYIK